MATPLTVSSAPLVFGTLSAIGTRHYRGDARAIYTQCRAYFLQGGLQLSLAAFEREPAATSALGLALAGEGASLLWLVLRPRDVQLSLCPAAPPPGLWAAGGKPLPPPEVQRTAGVDEQGWYWGGQLALAGEALAQAGCGAARPFGMALFKFDTALPGAFGASFAPADAAAPLCREAFPMFEPVDW